MTLKEYLQHAQAEYKARGTAYMVQVIDDIIDTGQNLAEAIEQCRASMETYERYSVDFQYYWSVLTYLESLQDCYTAASS